MKKVIFTLFAATALLSGLSAAESTQIVTVTVDPSTAQNYDGEGTLAREKFFKMHESPGSITGAEYDRMRKLGISLGRGTYSPFAGANVVKGTTDEQVREKAAKNIKSLTAKGYDVTPDLYKGVILASHATPKHSAGGFYAFHWKGEEADYTPEAIFAEKFFQYNFVDQGLKVPTYYEPMNEPFVKSKDYDGVDAQVIIKEMCRYHQQLNHHLKKKFPDMKVGGFGGAWPYFEGFKSDFTHWKRRMQLFIDIAGEDCDYFSFHIYDGRNLAGDYLNRSGSNMEALMDITQNYSEIKLGVRKPLLISEHGLTHKGMCGFPYTRERDWDIIKSLNHQTCQFMQRPDGLECVIPFILVKALWGESKGHPYPWVLMRKDGKGGWLETDLWRYFEFWSDLKGDYIFTQSSEIDIQALAFADGKRLSIVLNNLDAGPDEVEIKIPALKGNKCVKATIRTLYGEDGVATITEKSLSLDNPKIKLREGETAIVMVNYAKSIKPSQEVTTKRFYATSYLKPIKAGNTNEFELNIDKGEKRAATLKIAIARPTGIAIDPVLKVGDKVVPFPTDWKGYDQKGRKTEGFFGTIDVTIDPNILTESNKISLTFPEAGGTISTVGAVIDYTK